MHIHSNVSILPSRKKKKQLKYSTCQYSAIKKKKNTAEYNKLHHLSKQLIMLHQTCTWHSHITYD